MPSPMMAREDQSPSPPPRPTWLSPGIRASLLQKVYHDALSHTLGACSYANFASCFPTPAEHVPEALHGLHREFVSRLEENCKAEFTAVLEERNVVPCLNELDDLIGDARKRKERAIGATGADGLTATPPTPPHQLSPSALLTAYMSQFVAEQTAALTQQLETTQKTNTSLSEEISSQRGDIEQLVRGLELMVADLEQAATLLSEAALGDVDGGPTQSAAT